MEAKANNHIYILRANLSNEQGAFATKINILLNQFAKGENMRIRKDKKNGKDYYYLEKNRKRIESFGTHKPIRYIPMLLQGDVIDMLQHVPDNSVDLIM